jgi:organic hydroperoxide reductase OsmC/OhrA
MIQYPITFSTHVTAPCGINTQWKISSADHQATCAVPPEFEGPGGAFSPEDLYAQALTTCFVATFQVIAEKSRVTFENLRVEGKLVVDRDESKRPVMKTFRLKIQLTTPSAPERAASLVQKAIAGGFILNSVKTEITHELEIV